MKSKLLMFIATLVASAGPTMVQARVDATNYIVNPSFDINGVSGWTNSGFGAQRNAPNTFTKDGNCYIEKYTDPGKTLANSDIYQELTVPNGTYLLTVAAHARVNQNGTGAAYIDGAYIYANDQSIVVSEGKDYTIQIIVTDGTLKVGFKLDNSPANWVGADNFRLEAIDMDAKKGTLGSAITTATTHKASYTTYSGYTDFETAIATATDVYNSPDINDESINQGIADLKAAEIICRLTEPAPAVFTWFIANPNFEIYSYDKDQSIPGWTKTGTNDGEYCIRTDNGPAGKTGTGYFQYWSGAKPNYSISQTLAGVPNGKYKLTAFAGGDANTRGTYVYANNDQKEVIANGDQEVITLVVNNSLTIGFKSLNRTVNWSYADNFRLEYLGIDMADFENLLDVQLAIATDVKYNTEENYFSVQHFTDFQSVLTSAQGVRTNPAHTVDELISSAADLQDAIATADLSLGAQTRKAAILAAPTSDISSILTNPKFDDAKTTGWTTNMGIWNGNGSKYTGWDNGYDPVPANNYILDRNASGVSFGYQYFPLMPAGFYTVKAVIRGLTLTPSNLYLFINNGTDYQNAEGTVESTASVDRIGDTGGSLNHGFSSYTTGITVSEGDNITLGIRADNGETSRWQSADAFELHYYVNEIAFLSIEKDELLATATAIINEKMAATVKTALSTAMNADWNNLSTDDFRTATTTLKSAIDAANVSIAAYPVLDSFLTSVEAALSNYTDYSGYAAYAATVAAARTAYTDATTVDVPAAILDLKMAKNTCIYSDGAIHTNSNLLYGWDANKDGRTPEAAGWIASEHDLIWGGALTGPNDNIDALYRSDAIAPNYAFYAKAVKNSKVITYAYPVYLEAGKHYSFTGKNWRRNGQFPADACNVTFAISSTASKTGTILAEQTIYCDIANYIDYSFTFNVASTGVYYFIRYAAEGSTALQDASTALSIVETYSVTNGMATVNGELTDAIKAEFETAEGITSVDLSKATVASDMELAFNNPNTVVYDVPAGVTLLNGIAEGSTAELSEHFPFNAPVGLNATIYYERAEFTGISSDSNDNGWQSIVLPFDVVSIRSIDGNGATITLVPFAAYVEASDDRPFWLYKVEGGAYVAASSIEANTTYLISFPNAPSYNAAFNVSGPVTFQGTAIEATSLAAQPITDLYTLNPNFDGLKDDVYALNAAGSAWEKSSSTRGFHGYVTDPVGTGSLQSLPIFGEITGVKNVVAKNSQKVTIVLADNGVIIESAEAGQIMIYSTSGQLVATVVLQEGSNFVALPAGEYIIDGIVAIVK